MVGGDNLAERGTDVQARIKSYFNKGWSLQKIGEHYNIDIEIVLCTILDSQVPKQELAKILRLRSDIKELSSMFDNPMCLQSFQFSSKSNLALRSSLERKAEKISRLLGIPQNKILDILSDNANRTLSELKTTTNTSLMLFSYEPGTSRLHRASLLTGEFKVFELSKVFRWYMSWVELPSKALMFTGGMQDNTYSDDVFVVDTLRDFSAVGKSPMLNARKKHHCVCLLGYVYAIGGYRLTSCERFSLAENTWQSIPDLPTITYRHTAVSLEGKSEVYVLGGYTSVEGREISCDYIQVFNIAALAWSLLPLRLPYADSYIPCFTLPECKHSIFFLSEGSVFHLDCEAKMIKHVKEIDDSEVHSFFGASYYVDGFLYVSDIEGPVNTVNLGSLEVS